MNESILLFSIPKGPELIVIALVVVLLFGGKKIPDLMKGVGQGINQFKKGMKGDEENQLPGETKNNV